jgi:hypothetical protein
MNDITAEKMREISSQRAKENADKDQRLANEIFESCGTQIQEAAERGLFNVTFVNETKIPYNIIVLVRDLLEEKGFGALITGHSYDLINLIIYWV